MNGGRNGGTGSLSTWIARLAGRFDPEVYRLYLVADPDRLLAIPALQGLLRDRGFTFLSYDDALAFRYLYESDIRPRLLTTPDFQAIVTVGALPERALPYDLLADGKFVELGLHELVPRFNLSAVREVPPGDLARVVAAHARYQGQVLAEGPTREILLREAYGVSPAAFVGIEGVIEYLLRRHYAGEALPESLDRLLASQLCTRFDLGADDDILTLLRQPAAFYLWLQRDWAAYVRFRMGDGAPAYRVPFERPTIRVYLDNLFVDGLLTRVPMEKNDVPGWMRAGLALPQERTDAAFRDLLPQLDRSWPVGDASHQEWLAYAWRWAALRACIGRGTTEQERLAMVADLRPIQAELETAFAEWLAREYESLPSLAAASKPIMVHQIGEALRRRHQSGERVALVVLDGMALDHWLAIRSATLAEAWDADWEITEDACFAVVPTLTSLSRQAIFAGRLPRAFPDTWNKYGKEREHWGRLAEDWGLPRSAAVYATLQFGAPDTDTDPLERVPRVDEVAVQLLGLVINDIDQLGHAAKLGLAGMQDDVRLWAASGQLGRLFGGLLARGYTVYATADHGSVEAVGVGTINEGVLVEQRALRARVYNDEAFSVPILAQYPDAIAWPGIGLPPELRVILPRGLAAFAPVGETVVTHGGIALEELIVPFIRLGGRT